MPNEAHIPQTQPKRIPVDAVEMVEDFMKIDTLQHFPSAARKLIILGRQKYEADNQLKQKTAH